MYYISEMGRSETGSYATVSKIQFHLKQGGGLTVSVGPQVRRVVSPLLSLAAVRFVEQESRIWPHFADSAVSVANAHFDLS